MVTSGEGAESQRRKGALHEATTQRLRDMIVSGELAPGERLRESHYCQLFGVSRTPFREAVKGLAAEGLIELSPNKSPVVAKLSAEDLEHLYVVVSALEAVAGEEACRVITTAEFAEFVDLHSKMLAAYEHGDRAEYLTINHRIHRRVIEIARNPVLASAWEVLVPRVERARAVANLDRKRWLAALSEHSRMLAALGARDGAKLAQLTREHFMNGLSYSQRHVRQDPPV
ncbi:MAG TPA: GntR family transcriptional regulator [Citreicella sp.]|jgi:DNA-binding GntR family transcriptional regulator|uniref:DNA-binding transcriptional regulator, GntR family n=1 Tax=Salipiger marinus TaxID=555512 RepID=A0A1G8QUY3_9RHOB|nr:GntR family transcriptional regulator [Salipiger marinus]SDJ08542.1 DNA-binding transcriptional regulator, GntR family [Salipiger marinus]HBM60541.1 GntR family transcriptional regulator [Citreicella sp.]